ncbi:MAG: hypothetical protein ACKV2T_32400 [Kofleriaceae bacterium]
MNDDDQDALDTLQFVAQDTEVLPYDDLVTVEQKSLPCAEDEDPTTQLAVSGEITL